MAKEKPNIVQKIQTQSLDEGWISVMSLYDDAVEPGAFLCNWDIEDPELKDLLFLADKPSETKGRERAGEQVMVKWWICTKILIPDRVSKEEVPVVRTVLISPDRQVLSTLSKGILRSVELLRRMTKGGEIKPPMPMRIMATSTGTGSDMLQLVPAMLQS